MILALAAAFVNLAPARADGPLLPGYTLQDGQRIPAPTGYIQTGVISGEQQLCGLFVKPQDLFLDPATGNFVVADTGNNRVVVLDKQGTYLFEIGPDAGLKEPEGVFVDSVGDIWVADKGNKRVAVFSPDGKLKQEHFEPITDYLVGMDFTPSKVVVDRRGYIYIVIGSQNSLGVVVMDSTDSFRGFFGRTRIRFNLGRVIARFLATKEQRSRILRIQPAPLNNLFLDNQGFIYAVSQVLQVDQIQRLNSVGTNVYGEGGLRTGAGHLWDKLMGKEGIAFGETGVTWTWNDQMRMSIPEPILPAFIDLAVDDLGIVSVLDSRNNQVYQYDQAGNLLTIFGGTGLSEGVFSQPLSIVAGDQGYLYILDAGRGNIQVYRPTELTRLIHQASHEYFNGSYDKAAVLWSEIAQRNTNFAMAHSGLGKALMGQKRYLEAMQEYYYAEDKGGYSSAFQQYRYLWARANFGFLGIGIIVLVTAAGISGNWILSGFRGILARLSNFREHAGLWAAPFLLVLTVLSRMISLSTLSFHYQEQRPDQIRLLFESGKIIIPWVTWCISAFWVGEIYFGEGTFRRILISSAWALWPLIVLPIPLSLLTHILSLDEKGLYDILWIIIWILVVWQFFQVIKEEHRFEFGQSVFVVLLSLVGIIAIWILVGLVYALTAEIIRFISQIILEIYVRMY